MSDPVTNVEIEDVLSSIRRLVAAEERSDGNTRQGDETEDEADRLVLTPAQRVDDDQHGADARQDAAPEIEPPEIEPPVFRHRDRHNDDVEEAEIVHAPAAPEADDNTPAPEAFVTPEETGDPASGLTGATGTGEVDLKELEARIAGFEAAVAEQDEEWEPDGSAVDEDATGPVTSLPWKGAQVVDREDDPSPDRGRADSDTAPPRDTPEGGEATGSGEATERAEADGAGAAWYADEAVIDEAALRDMVGEIVRQELQGELGERITRNVRKLVRREIHRALMSQGVD
jgi:hypothetical protein